MYNINIFQQIMFVSYLTIISETKMDKFDPTVNLAGDKCRQSLPLAVPNTEELEALKGNVPSGSSWCSLCG